MRYRVGIDVGGTFTDLAMLSAEGRLHIFKVPSRPGDIATGCLEGLKDLLEDAGVPPAEVDYWSHGSTVATNAVVERTGAKVALLATKGFRDILEIRRQVKPDRYNLHRLKPDPLVPRDRRFEVSERILWDGAIYTPLDEHQLDGLIDSMETLGLEAVAICFLHSYVNPAHEKSALDRIRQRLPRVYVAVSHEVLPEFREYPRTATTVINAYVGPVMERYLKRFDEGGRAMGIRPPLTIFQSNGGITSASAASRLPVRVLHSGPAAGVHGAVQVARDAGHAHVITFDMGGTSCDVCLIRDGTPLLTGEKELVGFPVRSPMIDVHSIGAGGGSIAWVDKGGLLQVGPQSAGADPGPACYGRGGTSATVTDANVVLGRLNPNFLLGGRLIVHNERARDAVSALAKQLDLSLEEAALGILDVVNSNMMGAIRVVSVERGYDFRDFVLMGFGGAGPLHAADVAGAMGIRAVLVPRVPGILCAMGLLLADYRNDFTRTHILPASSEEWRQMGAVFAALEERARLWAAENGIPEAGSEWRRVVSMRYVGQSYQLPVSAPPLRGASDVDILLEAFYSAHTLAYGYALRNAPVETVDFHLTLVIPIPRPDLAPAWQDRKVGHVAEAQLGEREVWFKAGPVATPVYRRDMLFPGWSLQGPAILEQLDSTTVVPPQAQVIMDKSGNIHMKVS
jgi:N-methylhydantoinase A